MNVDEDDQHALHHFFSPMSPFFGHGDWGSLPLWGSLLGLRFKNLRDRCESFSEALVLPQLLFSSVSCEV